MRIDHMCSAEIRFIGAFHMARPYGNESGIGWGIGDGTVTGDRLSGDVHWSNHPRRRGDGVMLPNARGVITTPDHAEVFFELTGRTFFVERDGTAVGSQLLMALLESEDARYAWVNSTVCMAEGKMNTQTGAAHFEIYVCENALV